MSIVVSPAASVSTVLWSNATQCIKCDSRVPTLQRYAVVSAMASASLEPQPTQRSTKHYTFSLPSSVRVQCPFDHQFCADMVRSQQSQLRSAASNVHYHRQRRAKSQMWRISSRQRVLRLPLQLITPAEPLWRAGEDEIAQRLPDASLRELWWAFAWPGSYALAHYVQQRPVVVRSKWVLDVGTGCRLSALAAV